MRLLTYILLFFPLAIVAQEKNMKQYSVDVNYFYGSILPHHTNILHLIKGHPEGTIISFNRKTFEPKNGSLVQLSGLRFIIPISGQ